MWFYLLAGHALMDFALQGDATASCKCRGSKHPAAASVPWYYWLTSHALLHGAVVAVIIRWYGYADPVAIGFGVAETVIHWGIDYAKCSRWFGIHADQGLHVGCKLLWAALLAFGVVT
jgi:hypothetical protein